MIVVRSFYRQSAERSISTSIAGEHSMKSWYGALKAILDIRMICVFFVLIISGCTSSQQQQQEPVLANDQQEQSGQLGDQFSDQDINNSEFENTETSFGDNYGNNFEQGISNSSLGGLENSGFNSEASEDLGGLEENTELGANSTGDGNTDLGDNLSESQMETEGLENIDSGESFSTNDLGAGTESNKRSDTRVVRFVKTEETPIYVSPDLSAKIVGKKRQGDSIVVELLEDGWTKLDENAFVLAAALSERAVPRPRQSRKWKAPAQ